MSYTINRYNGTQITVVADGTIDATLDLKLIGKNYAGYGAVQNENFVYLLENFANTTQPPKPLPGQIWFDSGNNKLKFYDGNKFRTTGGAEIGSTAPTGLTIGDFWYDTVNNQLYAWSGTAFTLIGPQAVAGSGTTQMRSRSLRDTNGATHAVIEAVDNGQTVFIINSDSEFILDNGTNAITGFTKIRQGVTLCYTNDDTQLGQTTDSHRFWGTASNADRLGGFTASNFVQTGNATFSTLANFSDAGYTVGNPVARLHVFNDGAQVPTIQNEAGDTIVFQTTVSSTTKTPLKLVGTDILPGTTNATNIGSLTLQFKNIYAGYVYATASQADALNVGGSYRSASTAAGANTVVARDSSGNVSANLFQGTATSANYADLAEKYLADAEYEVGTVVVIGGAKEVTACGRTPFQRAIGVVSEKPAYLMNKDLENGTAIALKGRVPVKVVGPVHKGDTMVAAAGADNMGCAIADTSSPTGHLVFAIALEDNYDEEMKIVECLVL
jgi:hypothetical protein